MPILEARGLTKIFPGVVALDSVDITVELGEVHCIIGENGAGKSTLIKCLTGVYTPETGDVVIAGETVGPHSRSLFDRIAYAPQEIDLFLNLSVAENLFLPFESTGITGLISQGRLESAARPILERFRIGVNPGELVRDIPVSARQFLQIARATLKEGYQVLILDEPTTSLTARDAVTLFDIVREIRAEGKSVIFISHKLEEIFEIGDVVSVFRNGRNQARAAVDDASIPWVISQMTGGTVDQESTFRSEELGDDVLLHVDSLTGRDFTDVTLTLRKGEILGLYGLVGAGRSELMQAVFGYLPVYSGTVALLGSPLPRGNTYESIRRGLIYLSEERRQMGILSMLSVRSNLSILSLDRLRSAFGLSRKKEDALAREIVARYDVKTPHLDQPIQFLSGGNQQKVIIGRSMAADPKVIIFDEPTKGIDVATKVELYRMMKRLAEDRGVGIVLISSEIEEIRRCANRVVVLYEGRVAGEFGPETDQDEIMRAVIDASPSEAKEMK